MGKGRRYFDYAAGSFKPSSSSVYDPDKSYNERRFETENRKASEKLRMSIQGLTVDEQIDRRAEMKDIASGGGFRPREFVSKKKMAVITQPKDDFEPMDLDMIPMPANEKDWRQNPKAILSKSLLSGTPADRLLAFKKNLRALQKTQDTH